jgi:hypothetical protein
LIGCGLYVAPEQHRKIDSKEGKKELLEEAYDIAHVKAQKREDLLDSYQLNGGLKSFKNLEIVKNARIEKNRIEVEFFIKDMENKPKTSKSKEDIIWENALLLYYTIYDTFPEIEKIRLSADYHFLDQYGHPYKEELFISQTNRNQLKRINRDYFRPEMLAQIVDFYISDYATEKENQSNK